MKPQQSAPQGNPIPHCSKLSWHYTARSTDECLPVQTRIQIESLSPNYTISGALNGNWESPLTAAIRANPPHNVRLLLGAGADPYGISLRSMEDYSVRFN